jgi:hypothetical protein
LLLLLLLLSVVAVVVVAIDLAMRSKPILSKEFSDSRESHGQSC